MDEWMTVDEIAEALDVDDETVLDLLQNGPLPGVDFGGLVGWKVRRAEFDRFVQRQTSEGSTLPLPREDQG